MTESAERLSIKDTEVKKLFGGKVPREALDLIYGEAESGKNSQQIWDELCEFAKRKAGT